MEAMSRVLSPMRWILDSGVHEMRRSAGLLLWATCACMLGVSMGYSQETGANFTLEGLENRPYRLSEYHPFSATRDAVNEGQTSFLGEVNVTWPDDGRLHFLELECAGVIWSLPVCGPFVEGAALRASEKGGAPFTARPGDVLWSGTDSVPWTPVLVAEAQALVDRYAATAAADIQQSLLWGGASEEVQRSAGALLGSPFGGAAGAVDRDSLWSAHALAFSLAFDSLLVRIPAGAVREYIGALRWGVLPDLHPDSLAAFRAHWIAKGAPQPHDAAEVALFRQGLDRFATLDSFSKEERAAFGRAWAAGSLDSLSAVTGQWWDGPNEGMTLAWFLARIGDGGFGYGPPARFSRARALPEPMRELLLKTSLHGTNVAHAERLLQLHMPKGPLPKALRIFSGSGDLVRLEEVSGSGPVAWLWIDAGAPSTLVQLQVLERMMSSSQGRKRRNGAALPRDLTWVVVDAGSDWPAFERLVRDAAVRNGGLSRMPYQLLHAGGDIRWTEVFEIRSLPRMRHSGPGLQPTPSEPPLPGPALIDWLAKRS